MEPQHEDEHHHHHEIKIFIDKEEVRTRKKHLDGRQIRALHKPPIGEDRDLWLEVPGKGDDKKIRDDEEVHLHNDMRFYSTERKINPGSTA